MTYSNSGSCTQPRRRPAGGPGAYSRTVYRAPAPRRRRMNLAHVALIAALALALGGACAWAVTSLGALAAGTAGGSTSEDAPQSAPRSAWRAGEVPALYQRDPAWAQGTYAGAPFAETGCGPTCLAMAYVALTGRDNLDPSDLAALSERMGCASEDGTAWAFMVEGAAEIGLAAEEIPADEPSVRSALAAGRPVICSVGPGDFTSTGHFIVLAGVDANGRLLVRDPNSPARTQRAWDFDTVLGQCRNLWAYSAL